MAADGSRAGDCRGDDFRADDFRAEITSPVHALDPQTGEVYRLYLLNRRFDGARPVVVYNGFGSTPNTTMGQLYLREYARTLPRPLVAPMSAHVPRRTTRRAFADGHARALATVVDGDVDLAGLSWGGVVAYSVAEALGERARRLVTLSAVGTLDTLCQYAYRAWRMTRTEGPVVRDALKVVARDADPRDHEHASPALDPLSKLRRSHIMRGRSLQNLRTTLHPGTLWHDVVGVGDLFTDPRDHVDTVLARNARHPGSSRITLVTNHGHLWAHMKPQLAEVLRDSLAAPGPDPARPIDMLRARDDHSGLEQVPFP